MPWKQIMKLALAITVVVGALLWNEWQVDRDFHAVWLLLSRAKTKAREGGAGPVMVRFNGPKVIVEDRRSTVIESLRLPTLAEVRYKTTRADRTRLGKLVQLFMDH
jgi:hypothetical protein